MEIEVRPSAAKGKKAYLLLRSTNAQVTLNSETYASLWNGRRAARRLGRMFGIRVLDYTTKINPGKPVVIFDPMWEDD